MSYFKEVLLHLRRQYSKDEAVKALSQRISELEFEVGVLKSEKAELQDKLSRYKKNKEWDKESYILGLKHNIKKSQEQKNIHKKKAQEWQNKYFDLYRRLNENSPG